MTRDTVQQLLASAFAARQAGNLKGAFDALLQAACDCGDPEAGAHLAWMLMHMRLSAGHPDVDRAWVEALAAPWDRPARLAPGALAYLALDAAVAQALADPASPPKLAAAVRQLAARPLFHAIASTAIIPDLSWQKLLLAWRARALAGWLRRDQDWRAGLEWLALQANLCDYVWPIDVPATDLDALRRAGGPASVLLACFEHPGAAARPAFEGLLLQRLVTEPDEERHIREQLAADATLPIPAKAERDQYERYPYPRWVAEPRFAHAVPGVVQARMQGLRFERPQLLLAGCGTGLQCVAASATYPSAHITAIDFSLASLGYAVRKCREAGLGAIRFECADLLAYPERGSRFDLIECMGVLHHIPDLEAGAAALRRLATPGTLLRLAVYSARARELVHALRRQIARHRSDGSLPSLRAWRRDLLDGRCGELPPAFLASPDLHCASGLHDLLFNACEHVLGARAWAALLERHGFELVCLDAPAPVLSAAGPEARSWGPAEWEAYEQEHPFAFGGMYEFWFAAG